MIRYSFSHSFMLPNMWFTCRYSYNWLSKLGEEAVQKGDIWGALMYHDTFIILELSIQPLHKHRSRGENWCI